MGKYKMISRSEKAMCNMNRLKIISYLRTYPGAYLKDMSKVLRIGNGNLRQHLDVLKRLGYVRECYTSRKTIRDGNGKILPNKKFSLTRDAKIDLFPNYIVPDWIEENSSKGLDFIN